MQDDRRKLVHLVLARDEQGGCLPQPACLPDKLAFLRVERFAKIRKLDLQGLGLYQMTPENCSILYLHMMSKAVFINHLNLCAVDMASVPGYQLGQVVSRLHYVDLSWTSLISCQVIYCIIWITI